MKVHEIVALCNQYGENTTLAEIRQSIQGERKYLCPKCNGTGNITIEYNDYPPGLPDSYWSYIASYIQECDLCEGEGYTDKLMKPLMVQDGWE